MAKEKREMKLAHIDIYIYTAYLDEDAEGSLYQHRSCRDGLIYIEGIKQRKTMYVRTRDSDANDGPSFRVKMRD